MAAPEFVVVGHVTPEAFVGGTIALVEEGDLVEIDIPNRMIRLAVPDEELARRRAAINALNGSGWKPKARERRVSAALQAYAALTTSAARGAVRDVTQVQKR